MIAPELKQGYKSNKVSQIDLELKNFSLEPREKHLLTTARNASRNNLRNRNYKEELLEYINSSMDLEKMEPIPESLKAEMKNLLKKIEPIPATMIGDMMRDRNSQFVVNTEDFRRQ